MSTHIMIDMETLDTAPSCVILTIGAVKFDPKKIGIIEKLELRPTIDEQTDQFKRTINEDTVRWWGEQSPEAIMEAMGDQGRIPYKDCMEKLYKFCWNAQAVWSNGSGFDVVVAESAFRDLGMQIPWPFWTVRDCRTIYDLTGVSLKDTKYASKTTHKAVDDAVHQVMVLQDGYKKLMKAGIDNLR